MELPQEKTEPYGCKMKRALIRELCSLIKANKTRNTTEFVSYASLSIGLRVEKIKEYMADLVSAGFVNIVNGHYVVGDNLD